MTLRVITNTSPATSRAQSLLRVAVDAVRDHDKTSVGWTALNRRIGMPDKSEVIMSAYIGTKPLTEKPARLLGANVNIAWELLIEGYYQEDIFANHTENTTADFSLPVSTRHE